MAALPPAPTVNRDVPVITSAGGSSAAYKDPNSPESIMKKTTQTEAQGITDTRFDVPPDAFMNYSPGNTIFLPCFSVILFLFIVLSMKRIQKSIRTFFLAALVLLLVLCILRKKNEP
jgi:hypothetical protein